MIGLFSYNIRNDIPFIFTKIGDGESVCISKKFVEGRDGNGWGFKYSMDCADKLIDAMKYLFPKKNVYIGKWIYDAHEAQIKQVMEDNNIPEPNYIDYCTILHMADTHIQNKTYDIGRVKDFYLHVELCPDRKLYVCPERLNHISKYLKCDTLNIPLEDCYSQYESIKEKLIELSSKYKMILYSASLMSKILIADVMKVNDTITQIDIGSAFDMTVPNPQTMVYQISGDEFNKLYNL